eukprot:GHVS01072947.1.p1 GENE.GHVS01072947.1~~GHVS01072947.1.p1  ORF type:complete len:109 (+),score=6.26 GHVS01072947.1:157-483(+)
MVCFCKHTHRSVCCVVVVHITTNIDLYTKHIGLVLCTDFTQTKLIIVVCVKHQALVHSVVHSRHQLFAAHICNDIHTIWWLYNTSEYTTLCIYHTCKTDHHHQVVLAV